MVILIMLLSQFEALGDQSNIPLCGFYSHRRLLLEGVEHIASPPKAHLVHRPIGVGREVVNDFEYPGPFRPATVSQLDARRQTPPVLKAAPMLSFTGSGKLNRSSLDAIRPIAEASRPPSRGAPFIHSSRDTLDCSRCSNGVLLSQYRVEDHYIRLRRSIPGGRTSRPAHREIAEPIVQRGC